MYKKIIEGYKNFVEIHYATKDIAHNFSHIERIICTVDKIISYCAYENLDYSLLAFLQCFHGLNRKLESDDDFKQETVNFLISQGWTSENIANAFQSLKCHCKSPKNTEEDIVYDANFIEVVGAFGLARAFNSAGMRGQSVEEIASILKTHYYDVIQCRFPMGKPYMKKEKNFLKNS